MDLKSHNLISDTGVNEAKMNSKIRKGSRCQARVHLRTHAGPIAPMSQGTVVGEIESLGRRLIAVQWDCGFCVYTFPDEIETITDV